MQRDTTTPNIAGPTITRVVAFVCKWIKVWPVSNFAQQLPTTRKRVWKRTQHVTSNNVASVCTGLYICKYYFFWLCTRCTLILFYDMSQLFVSPSKTYNKMIDYFRTFFWKFYSSLPSQTGQHDCVPFRCFLHDRTGHDLTEHVTNPSYNTNNTGFKWHPCCEFLGLSFYPVNLFC